MSIIHVWYLFSVDELAFSLLIEFAFTFFKHGIAVNSGILLHCVSQSNFSKFLRG